MFCFCDRNQQETELKRLALPALRRYELQGKSALQAVYQALRPTDQKNQCPTQHLQQR